MGDKVNKGRLDPQGSTYNKQSRETSPHSRSPSPGLANANFTLVRATKVGDLSAVLSVLKAVPSCVDSRSPRGRTALHDAAESGDTAIALALLEHGADVNARSYMGFTPLTFAATFSHTQVMRALITAKADLNAQATSQENNLLGQTPLHRAVVHESLAATQLLAFSGASIDSATPNGVTALHVAVQKASCPLVLILSAFGADPYLKDTMTGANAISWAQALDPPRRNPILYILHKWAGSKLSVDIVQASRENELLRFFDVGGTTNLVKMLCWGAAKGRPGVVEYALEMAWWTRQHIVNAPDEGGRTALHNSVHSGTFDVTKIILKHGAAVDCLTRDHRWTPLLTAAKNGRQWTIMLLLDSKADLLAMTHDGRTALDLATLGGPPRHEASLKILANRICDTYDTMSQDPKRRVQATAEYRKALAVLGYPVPEEDHHTQEASEIKDVSHTDVISQKIDKMSLWSGAFDGTMFSVSSSPDLVQSETFNKLINTWDTFFEFKDKDKRVRVAVLDTGFDSTHRDWENPRALRFRNNKPESDDRDVKQRDRIIEFRDFCGDGAESASGVDIDGHGTQVASIVLRYAPRADIYVARICKGDKNRGLLPNDQTGEQGTGDLRPQPNVVAAAIDWAIDKKVDIVNLSFGFHYCPPAVKAALKRAKDAKILVFAAMSNGGNNPDGAAWPARDLEYAIGIHSCREGGHHISDFTPKPVGANDNVMVVGEGIVTHWPEAKGGGFRFADGTSFATPVAVAMAALVLAFCYQDRGKKERREIERSFDLEALREARVMSSFMTQEMGLRAEHGTYTLLRPELLWRDYNLAFPFENRDPENKRRHAWNVIRDTLSRQGAYIL